MRSEQLDDGYGTVKNAALEDESGLLVLKGRLRHKSRSLNVKIGRGLETDDFEDDHGCPERYQLSWIRFDS